MIINLELKNASTYAAEVEANGFCIIKNAVNKNFINDQRTRWLSHFEINKPDKKFVRGSLILGEPNFSSYSKIPAWCMHRFFEFLWNESDDPVALAVHMDIHRFRNKMQGFDENYGINYNKDLYGIYISTSYYPIGEGMLKPHCDGHGDTPILHYMLPLTFKGEDYQDGGLNIESKSGEVIDLETYVKPGDLIFFDGRQRHWVNTIKGDEKGNTGRLAVFAIPTFFNRSFGFAVTRRSTSIQFYEIINKLRHIIPVLKS